MANIDPITAEVIRGTMETVAFEVATHLSLAAVTPILNQSNERNASILDAEGRLAAVDVGIPQLMLASRGPVNFALEFFGKEGFQDGDVFVGNDPYHGGGHLPDWNVFAPVVVDGELVLIVSIQCHHGDTGGETPGGYCVEADDVWTEGLRVPTLKIIDQGVERKDVFYMLQTNNRLATHLADVRAQAGAATHGARRLKDMTEQYGIDVVKAAVQHGIDLTARKVRDEIRTWADGVYEGKAFVEHDTIGNKDIRIHCKATIEGDSLTLDYSESDRRQNLTTNGTLGNTEGMVCSQLFTMLDPDIPKNEGLFHAFDLIVPQGTCINPEPGRPVSAGTHHPGVEVSEALCQALSQVVPDRAQPQAYKIAIPTVIYGSNPKSGELFVDHSVDTTSTCACASSTADGWGGPPTAFGNVIMATAEVNESLLPQRQLGRDLMTDTGGPGRWRGQPGARYVKEVTADCQVYTWVLGVKYPVKGVAGGRPGSANRVFLKVDSPEEYEVKHTAFYIAHKPGEKIITEFASGSGWGDPYDRPPEAVLEDVLDEYVSVQGAARDYGVVVEGDLEELDMRVNVEATEQLRVKLRKEREERGPEEDEEFDWTSKSVQDYIQRVMPAKLGDDAGVAGSFRGEFLYDLDSDGGGKYTITIGDGSWDCREGTTDQPVFSLTMSGEDFVKMVNGELNAQDAFTQGRLAFDGDVQQAMKLSALFS